MILISIWEKRLVHGDKYVGSPVLRSPRFSSLITEAIILPVGQSVSDPQREKCAGAELYLKFDTLKLVRLVADIHCKWYMSICPR